MASQRWAQSVARRLLKGVPVHHGYAHSSRVAGFARQIAIGERFNREETRQLLIAAWLHDVGRSKDTKRHALISAEIVHDLLNKEGEGKEAKQNIVSAIYSHSRLERASTELGCALKDADMLDGFGQIVLEREITSKHPGTVFDQLWESIKSYKLPDEMRKGVKELLESLRTPLGWYGLLTTRTARSIGITPYAELKGYEVILKDLLAGKPPPKAIVVTE